MRLLLTLFLSVLLFAGTAEAFQKSLSTEPLLILTALLAIYIVLGMLYESLVHPITILTTLPSASGVRISQHVGRAVSESLVGGGACNPTT